MKCCPDVHVKCPWCQSEDEYVHLSLKNGEPQGFGCLKCGTAEKKGELYVRKEK